VIPGAGYDSRAYRFNTLKDPIRVFEVDHPATQQAKLDKLQKIFDHLPPPVCYVPIDFNEQALEECLAAHGYNPVGKTVFPWQGVTYYLNPTAVDQILDFIAKYSAPGSKVIFEIIISSDASGDLVFQSHDNGTIFL
jgi:methyltransferase (TIGR00027 family)